MKQQKNQPQTPPQEVPAKPLREVPKVERERAENEGMTVKPNRDSTNLEDVKIGKAHSQEPQNDGLEGEGSYTAARRYREGLERSVQDGNADDLAQDAADALDGPEGADLRHAEQRGKMTPPGVQKEQQKLQQKDQDV